jgi:hypothetical protein
MRVAGEKGRKNEEATEDQGCFRIGLGVAFVEGVRKGEVVNKEEE